MNEKLLQNGWMDQVRSLTMDEISADKSANFIDVLGKIEPKALGMLHYHIDLYIYKNRLLAVLLHFFFTNFIIRSCGSEYQRERSGANQNIPGRYRGDRIEDHNIPSHTYSTTIYLSRHIFFIIQYTTTYSLILQNF